MTVNLIGFIAGHVTHFQQMLLQLQYRAVKRHCATVPFIVFPDPSSGARPWVQVLNAVICLTVVV